MIKELFIDSIRAIQLQWELDTKIASYLSLAFPDAFEANLLPQNSNLRDAIVHILAWELNDNDGFIDYFIYDLDYGKKYTPGCMGDENGKDIDISDSGKLYDFLTE